MGLETRSGRITYYRKVRRGARVVSVYEGSGELALLAASDADEARAEAAADRRAWEEERARLDEGESRVSRAIRDIDSWVAVSLEREGWHRPSRKLRWLRKRGTKDTNMGHAVAVRRSAAPSRCSPGKAREIVSLALSVGATSGGIQLGIMDEFRELIRTDPRAAAEAASVLGLAIEAANIRSIVDAAVEAISRRVESGDRDVVRALVEVRLDVLRDDLAGPDPTPAEWHLAGAAALAWLDWQRCLAEREGLDGATPLPKAAYHERRADRANTRFVRATKALAAVRKLPPIPIAIMAGAADVARINGESLSGPATGVGPRSIEADREVGR